MWPSIQGKKPGILTLAPKKPFQPVFTSIYSNGKSISVAKLQRICSNHRSTVVCVYSLLLAHGLFHVAWQRKNWLGWAACESQSILIFNLDKYQKGQMLLRNSSHALTGEIKLTGVSCRELHCKWYQKRQVVPSFWINKDLLWLFESVRHFPDLIGELAKF